MTKAHNAKARLEPGKILVSACGRNWTLLRPADLESLWQSIDDEAFAEDERLPYWVELWPASLALAEHMLENKERIAGKTCLDLGCGLGFTALVAAWLGARVIGVDYEPEALAYAARNVPANLGDFPDAGKACSFLRAAPLWTVMDWRRPAVRAGSCDWIWGGDIMYERRFVRPVFVFLEHALAPGGRVWLAEPGRNIFDFFAAEAQRGGWTARRAARHSVEPLHEQKSRVDVNLWELFRSG